MNSVLRRPTTDEIYYLYKKCQLRTQKVGIITADDFPNWEEVLKDPSRNPVPRMQIERQKRNDCQGNAVCNGQESSQYKLSGVMPDLSEMYAYCASLYIMGARYVGVDQGSTIHSGARLVSDGINDLGMAPGLPLMQDWPYERWCRNADEFRRYCRGLQIQESVVNDVGEMPKWRDALACLAAGASIHIGTFWNVNWRPFNNKRLMVSVPRDGGGHATEIIWAEFIDGVWYMVVWNSHGDGWYYIPEGVYNQLQKTQCHPFGGYALYPNRIVERYYDRVKQGGGLFQ
jgi:hypothetical protein